MTFIFNMNLCKMTITVCSCLEHVVWLQSIFKNDFSFLQQHAFQLPIYQQLKHSKCVHNGLGTKSAVDNLSTEDRALGDN